MATILVTYDLLKPGRNYQPVWDYLLGHKGGRVTTHYSAAEIGNLVQAANEITKSRKSPALTLLRVQG